VTTAIVADPFKGIVETIASVDKSIATSASMPPVESSRSVIAHPRVWSAVTFIDLIETSGTRSTIV
jgi:hypothetical protein